MSVQNAINNETIFTDDFGLKFKFVDGWAAGCLWHKIELVETFTDNHGDTTPAGTELWLCEGVYQAQTIIDDGETFNDPDGEHGGSVVPSLCGMDIGDIILRLHEEEMALEEDMTDEEYEAHLEQTIGTPEAWLNTIASGTYNTILMYELNADGSRDPKLIGHTHDGAKWTTRTLADLSDVDDSHAQQLIFEAIIERFIKKHRDADDRTAACFHDALSNETWPVDKIKTYAINEYRMNLHAEGYADGLKASHKTLSDWLNENETITELLTSQPYYFTGGAWKMISATRKPTGELSVLLEVDDETYHDGTRKPRVHTEKLYGENGHRRTYWVSVEL